MSDFLEFNIDLYNLEQEILNFEGETEFKYDNVLEKFVYKKDLS